ncbi:ammonium transporter [Nocardia otitidiscaviarum]|nr:ammonium transporter [Nocardia otitidiscaviarum]MCP9621190.1 ammonium transporter [Nocardia otitidiscaviarum]
MKIGQPQMYRKITAVAAPVITALAIGTGAMGTAQADSVAPDIGYEAKLVGNTVVTSLTNGTFQLAGNSVNINDNAGRTWVSLPLAFQQDGTEYSLPHNISADGATLSLTAIKDESTARPAAIKPVASPKENLLAQQTFASQFGIATAIGAFIGTALGAAVGLTGIVSGPGVIASVIAGAAIGGIIGTLVVGGPTLIIAGIDLINTLMAPPGTSKFAGAN